MLAPLGALGSAAPGACSGVEACRTHAPGLSDSKSLLRTPPLVPTLPKVAWSFRFFRPRSPNVGFLADFWPTENSSKIIQNLTPQKSGQNPENPAPERQKYRILSIFDDFWMTKNHAKSRTAKTSYFEGSVVRKHYFYTSRPPILASIFHQNFLFFLETAPGRHFSSFFLELYRKN